ncbi:hypothetical protein MRX96_057955 [Rhipicephalus microplus]
MWMRIPRKGAVVATTNDRDSHRGLPLVRRSPQRGAAGLRRTASLLDPVNRCRAKRVLAGKARAAFADSHIQYTPEVASLVGYARNAPCTLATVVIMASAWRGSYGNAITRRYVVANDFERSHDGGVISAAPSSRTRSALRNGTELPSYSLARRNAGTHMRGPGFLRFIATKLLNVRTRNVGALDIEPKCEMIVSVTVRCRWVVVSST